MKTFVLHVALCVIAVLCTAYSQVTVRVPLAPSEEVAVLTFDDSRVAVGDLQRWMKVAKGSYYSAPVVQFFSKCTSDDIPQLDKGIKKTNELIDELQPEKYPSELSDVIIYLRNWQSLWHWEAQQELAFLKDRTVPNSFAQNSINSETCKVSAEHIQEARNDSAACRAFVLDWHNCVNDTAHKQLGEYPEEKWKAFLNAKGIQERLESTIGD